MPRPDDRGRAARGLLNHDQFRRAAIAEIRRALPGYTVTADPDDRGTIDVADPATPSLQAVLQVENFYLAYRQSGDLAAALARVREAVNSEAAAAAVHDDLDWAATAPSLLVQLAPPFRDQPFPARGDAPATTEAIPGVPGPFGLTIYPVIDTPHALIRPMAAHLAAWGQPVEAVVAAGMERTRAALAAAPANLVETVPAFPIDRGAPGRATAAIMRGLVETDRFGPFALRVFDNTLPGYDATRLLFPATLGLPAPGHVALVLAPERDLVLVVEGAPLHLPGMIVVSGQLADPRRPRPYPVLPGRPLLLEPDGTLRDPAEPGVASALFLRAKEGRR